MLNDEPNYEEIYDSNEDYKAEPNDNYDPEGDYEKADYDYTRQGANGQEEEQLAKELKEGGKEGEGTKSKKAEAEQYGEYYDYDYNGEGKKKNSIESDRGHQHLHKTQAGNDINEEEEEEETDEVHKDKESPHEEQHVGGEFTHIKEEANEQSASNDQHENADKDEESEEDLLEEDTPESYNGEDIALSHNGNTMVLHKSSQPVEDNADKDTYDDSEEAEEADQESSNNSEDEEEALDIDEEYAKAVPGFISSSTPPPPPPSRAMTSDDEDLGEGSGADESPEKVEEAIVKTVEHGEISPEKQHAIRLAFYDVHEIDILHLDTTCTTDFKQAPKIQHANVR
jgi:hypothetical protein